ncbi:DUF2867 domain-containing protein [Celeribacter baekdonensis]|uniref:DUF2867 domain-containing protein n=1 Tax=Celeribacter baekdonensis TaxID=875171 RepID=UPI0030DD2ECA|tara:strand:+ start:177208 stop:177660 length:453 start_codon:yes stop_codon:yes gene_type:complete
MSRVIKTPLPKSSRLWPHVAKGDFIDGYAVESTLSPREAAEIALSMPGWADALLSLRNRLVKPFGLKTEVSETGERAIFPVDYEGADELIIGTNDTHLNFRICIHQQAGHIHMATWVHRNNALGHVYLMLVTPFHVLIVRSGLRRIARAR